MAGSLNADEAKQRFRSALSGAGRRSAFSTVQAAKTAFREAAVRSASREGAGGWLMFLRRTGLLDAIMPMAARVLAAIRGR
jgi:hypothetical protein